MTQVFPRVMSRSHFNHSHSVCGFIKSTEQSEKQKDSRDNYTARRCSRTTRNTDVIPGNRVSQEERMSDKGI